MALGTLPEIINLVVPPFFDEEAVEVMESDFEDIDVLIGMDVIIFGDFLITNKDGKTIFQFRTPSEGGLEL